MSEPAVLDYPSNRMTAAEAETAERLLFLRKTYSKVLIGLTIFAGTIVGVHEIPWLQKAAVGLFTTNWWLWILLLMAASFGVRMLARTRLGMIGYVAFAVFEGLIVGPLTVWAGEGTSISAAVLTLTIFSGLTAYVFITKQDFSFLRGILWVGMFGLFGVAILGIFMGFPVGVWYSAGGALLMCGYILYDTSRILLHCRTDESLPAAIELFADVVLLFWYVLMRLMNRE